jgi:hypothetical protein
MFGVQAVGDQFEGIDQAWTGSIEIPIAIGHVQAFVLNRLQFHKRIFQQQGA